MLLIQETRESSNSKGQTNDDDDDDDDNLLGPGGGTSSPVIVMEVESNEQRIKDLVAARGVLVLEPNAIEGSRN